MRIFYSNFCANKIIFKNFIYFICAEIFDKLGIKYQSDPKSRKINAITQQICIYPNPYKFIHA